MFWNKKKLPKLIDATPEERAIWYAEYGQIMHSARMAMGISLSELSEYLKIEKQTLSDYEYGHPVPFIEGIAIYQYLGMRRRI